MAKDQNDKQTRNLLASSDAQRQQRRRDRMKAQGFKQKLFWVKADDFEQGASDFKKGKPMLHNSHDEFSYCLGYMKARIDSTSTKTRTSTSTNSNPELKED